MRFLEGLHRDLARPNEAWWWTQLPSILVRSLAKKINFHRMYTDSWGCASKSDSSESHMQHYIPWFASIKYHVYIFIYIKAYKAYVSAYENTLLLILNYCIIIKRSIIISKTLCRTIFYNIFKLILMKIIVLYSLIYSHSKFQKFQKKYQ